MLSLNSGKLVHLQTKVTSNSQIFFLTGKQVRVEIVPVFQTPLRSAESKHGRMKGLSAIASLFH